MKKPQIKQLDKLWAKIIIAGRNDCEWCHRFGRVEAAHIFGRNNHSTRWLKINGVRLCCSCHRLGKTSAHQSPIEYAEWIKKRLGVKEYERLRLLAHTPAKHQNYDEIRQELTKGKL